MSVRIEVDQVRTVEDVAVYRVSTTVAYANGIDDHIFVYDVESAEFSHVAYPYDMRTYPKTQQEALDVGMGFYRQLSAVKDYVDEVVATDAAAYTLGRIDTLATTMYNVDNEFVGNTSHTSVGG